MKATQANFLTLIKGPKQFVIPIYQRTYSWKLAQCQKLFEDILSISKNDKINGHFVGSIVYFQESIHTVSDVPELLVIDGQQRLTTITLLIAALKEFLENNQVDIETTPSKLQNYYLFNPEEDGDLKFKLLLTRNDKNTLFNILNGVSLEENHSLRVKENYEYFSKLITKENALDLYNGLMRLFVVDVALEKDKDNPQLIFESLNSTGLDLSQADLIRNYILMGQELESQTHLYEKYWYPMQVSYGDDYSSYFDWFMRDYLSVVTGSIPKIGYVYESFKQYVESDKSSDNIEEIVSDIHRYSEFYVRLRLGKEPNTKLREAFKRISTLKVIVSYPFLLPIYNDYEDGLIDNEEFLSIILLVESYVFRRAICGIPTNSLNKTFATFYKGVKKESYLESIMAEFILLDGYKRFPSNQEFMSELKQKDVYNFRNRNYLLDQLENYNRKERVHVDEYTIEHIIPQNPKLNDEWVSMLGENWKDIQDKYLHTIGNLTLTAYNSELSDRPFSEKKKMEGGFDDSPVRINRLLKEVDNWNEQNINLRAESLTDIAKNIWAPPQLDESILDKYMPEPVEVETYTIDQYKHLEGNTLDLFNVLRIRILNIDSSVKEEYKKLYVAYKSNTNFVDIIPQKSGLVLSLDIPIDKVYDPRGLCRDVSGIGRWGNGIFEGKLSNQEDMDYFMDLIEQAFDHNSDF